MSFQTEKGIINWNMHFSSSPEKVYNALTTDKGRSLFWAESTKEHDGFIEFNIYGYEPFKANIYKKEPYSFFSLEYVGTLVEFTITSDGKGGTDLHMRAEVPDEALRFEMIPGWISVLMAMKASVDFGVDLRNHDKDRCWNTGFADN